MPADEVTPRPVWALATEATSLPDVLTGATLTPARLSELRTVLASLADVPVVTLEAHPVSTKRDRRDGIALHAASPLARQLSQLVGKTAKTVPGTATSSGSGEVLYRMVVPAKVAAQVGKGLVQPMKSKAVAGGIHSALRDSAGIAANATFVPVASKTAVAGAATGSATTAGVAVATGGALTVAAPLVLMAVAVSVSAYADHQRQQAIERIADLLEELQEDKLEDERSELAGCRDAIDKATSIVLDEGRIGLSLGLDSAVHAIGKSIERTRTRLGKWQNALANLPEGQVAVKDLVEAFPGIDADGGKFRAHLELANAAIALKRRVLVLQAVEHAQLEGESNPFEAFVRALQHDERRVDELEKGIVSVLQRLATIELKRASGFKGLVFTQGEVDSLLSTAYRLRALGESLGQTPVPADVEIEIERSGDGSLTVYPATSI